MTLVLLDAYNLYSRAWYATRHEAMTADGESTAALVVFANTLLRHLSEERPDRVAVCWDGGASAYRRRLLPDYKGTRNPARHEEMRSGRDQIREFLALAGIFQVQRSEVEADDLIALYWHNANEPVVVVSEDKDFLMLAGPNPQGHDCQIIRSTGERWTAELVQQRTGATPRRLPSVMALTGDVSDNIPGVPGIGPKTAVALLEEAGWDLEAVEHPDVAQMRPQVRLSRALVNLRDPLPGLYLPDPPSFAPTREGAALYADFVGFLERYRLKGLLGRLYSGTLWSAVPQMEGPRDRN